MRKKLFFYCFLIFTGFSTFAQGNNMVLFDNNWRFHPGGAQGAEAIDFNDAGWRMLDLPHDWSIENRPGTNSPFDSNAISQVSGGFTAGGTGWYRKKFVVPAADKEKHLVIQFDGVYMNAQVWINGQRAGDHPYGYTSFYYDITKYVKFGETNVVAVEVKNEGQNSRWYSGSGIYRHVWLETINEVHIAKWGSFITTPAVSAASAIVNIKTKAVNETNHVSAITSITRVLNDKGVEIARSESAQNISPNAFYEFNQQAIVKNPQLWSVESPTLYTVVTEIRNGQETAEKSTNTFGIRTISFDIKNGFQLNGKTVKLKGGCFHHDNGSLGAKAYDRAEERKAELLKASGFNAIRCSHNPPSPAFLNVCDRLGMLVIDETFDMWNYGKNPYDYHLYFKDWWQRDVESMVNRDKNHPCIIMWSIGNEIPERGNPEGVQTAKMLSDYIKSLDTTRAITAAVNGLNEDKDPFFAVLDIAGYNYAAGGDHLKKNIYELDHSRVPNRIMAGTESYPWEAFQSWMDVIDHPYVIGDFVWTAFDYIGEASLGWLGYSQNADFYPWNLAFCGDIDICGWKRPQSYYRDALWKNDQVAVFVKSPTSSYRANKKLESWSKWNWEDVSPGWNFEGMEGKPLEVNVYSSCKEVELFFNNKSLGKKPTNRSTKFIAKWSVPYSRGELKAIGYNGNKKVNTAVLKTAGKPSQIHLTADRLLIHADGRDLSYVTVELKDENGNTNPLAEDLIKFEITGNGTIAGVGNANPVSIESNQLPQRKAWKGKCLVIIKAGKQKGNIVLTASCNGLKDSQIILKSN